MSEILTTTYLVRLKITRAVDAAMKKGVPLLPSRVEELERQMYLAFTPDLPKSQTKGLKTYCFNTGAVEILVATTDLKKAQRLMKCSPKLWEWHGCISKHPVDKLVTMRNPHRLVYASMSPHRKGHRLAHYHPTMQQAYADGRARK